VEIEGELYSLGQTCERLIGLLKQDEFVQQCIEEHGLGHVAERFARIIRRRFGDENSGTYRMDRDGLKWAVEELRHYYFDCCIQKMIRDGTIEPVLDEHGEIRLRMKEGGK